MFESISELEARCDLENKQLKEVIDNGKKWGNWQYSPSLPPSIDYVHPTRNYRYEIVLTTINDYSSLGSWLVHLGSLTWATPDDLGQLVKAIMDLYKIKYHWFKEPFFQD
jgi:hypothetical protein